MNKLRLLKKLDAEGLLERLNGDELRLLLYMIAICTDNGDGELHGDELKRIFGRHFTMKRLETLFTKLENLCAVRLTPCFMSCSEYDGFVMTYRIAFTK